ncbi:MAG: hypothetical protein JW781_00045 [Deltaproteobacteria bacterium]|nr:hypothetical protein [Candidatus Anaeroferrophillacea bacterium]
MNILVPTFSYPYESAQHFDGKFVKAEVEAYAGQGVSVRVVTPHYRGAPEAEFPGSGIEIHRFHYFFPFSLEVLKKPGRPVYQADSWLACLQIPCLLLAMAVTIWRHARWADLIHAQWTVTALLALPARWLYGTRIILTARGSDIRLLPEFLNRFIHARVDAAIDCFGPQPWNENYKKRFSACYLTLPLLVSAGVKGDGMPADLEDMLADAPDDVFVMVYVGRFDSLKMKDNHLPLLLLVEAAKRWEGEKLPFRLIYLGSGHLRPDLQKMVDRLGLGKTVYVLGPRMNVMDYLRYADLGIGGIAFNAVSQEMTISSTAQLLVDCPDNQGTPWRSGDNCLMIKPDDLDDLVAVGRWAMINRPAVRKLGEQARCDMAPYLATSEEGGGKYVDAFKELLSMNDC